jgi:hypothetical protein
VQKGGLCRPITLGCSPTRTVHHGFLISKSNSLPDLQCPRRSRYRAQFLAPESTFWIGAPISWKGDTAHPAPRRAIFVTARGEHKVTTSGGEVRRFLAGSVLLLEDTTGVGHSTTITSKEDCIVFAVGLPAQSTA